MGPESGHWRLRDEPACLPAHVLGAKKVSKHSLEAALKAAISLSQRITAIVQAIIAFLAYPMHDSSAFREHCYWGSRRDLVLTQLLRPLHRTPLEAGASLCTTVQ